MTWAGGLWKQIGHRDAHTLRQLLSTDEKCNVPDPKDMLKAAGGNKGFILAQIKTKESNTEMVWAGLGNENFNMASVWQR